MAVGPLQRTPSQSVMTVSNESKNDFISDEFKLEISRHFDVTGDDEDDDASVDDILTMLLKEGRLVKIGFNAETKRKET
jgi:hypothetical protein